MWLECPSILCGIYAASRHQIVAHGYDVDDGTLVDSLAYPSLLTIKRCFTAIY